MHMQAKVHNVYIYVCVCVCVCACKCTYNIYIYCMDFPNAYISAIWGSTAHLHVMQCQVIHIIVVLDCLYYVAINCTCMHCNVADLVGCTD